MFVLPTRTRRVVYVTLFEIIAIISSAYLLALLSNGSSSDSLPVAAAISFIAVVWNFIFNTLFEAVERKRNIQKRNIKTRVVHSTCFEMGLLLIALPIYMYWYSVGIVEALRMEAAILVFFLIYTFVFTWLFDLVFALPRNSVPKPS